MEQTLEQIKKLIGEPRNYGPTPEEKAEMDRRAMEEKVTTPPPYSLRKFSVQHSVCY